MFVYISIITDTEEEKQKFLQVYELHKKKMLYTAFGILHNQYDAEDAVQDALIAIAKHLNAINNPNDYRTTMYVTKVAKNMALKILKKKKKNPILFENTEFDVPDSFDFVKQICEREEVKIILEEIYKLDDIYRDVLYFYFVNGLTTKEIADLLGRNHNTVKSQLNRGRNILLSILNTGGYYEKL